MRKYKTVNPNITIKKIKDIYLKYKINYDIKLIFNKFNFCSSYCRLMNNKYLQTNGKGISEKYSIASALGESLERLQSLFIFNKNGIKYETLIQNIKDIKINGKKSLKNFNDLNNNFLKEIYNFDEDGYYTNFYWFNQKKEIRLPINYLINNTGTNGLASGNSYEECIIQGICECFERYVLLKVYNNEISPPIIDEEILKKYYKNYYLIDLLKKNNFKIYVFDLSCGLKLPVVGTLIINKKNNNAIFKLGSEPVFTYALNRCLSETFQQLDSDFFEKINNKIFFYNISEDFNYNDFILNVQFGLKLPNIENLFYKNSYELYEEFIKGENVDNSFLSSLKYIFDILKNLNKEIFIKDFNFLGFPTVYIYIEEISNIENNFLILKEQIVKRVFRKLKKEIYNKMIEIFKDKNIENLNYSDLHKIIVFFEILYEANIKYNLDLDPSILLFNVPSNTPLNIRMTLLFLYLTVNNLEKAKSIISEIDKDKLEKNKLLCIIRDYIYLMPKNNMDFNLVLEKLKFIYDSKTLNNFVLDVKNKRVLKYLFINKDNKEFKEFINFKNYFFSLFKNKIELSNHNLFEVFNKI